MGEPEVVTCDQGELVEVMMHFNESPNATGWIISQLLDSQVQYDGIIAEADVSFFFPSDILLANTDIVQSICLEKGTYKFVVYDMWKPTGVDSYYITSNGKMISQGRDFGSEEEIVFDIPYEGKIEEIWSLR